MNKGEKFNEKQRRMKFKSHIMQQDGCSDSTGPDYFIQSMFQEGHLKKEFRDLIE